MSTDLLFLLAIVAFWVLQQLASRRQQQQKPRPASPTAAEPDEALGDALSEIRRALGMETEPPPAPTTRRTDEFHRVETGRGDSEERFENRRAERPGSEDRFERRTGPSPVYDDVFERAAPYQAMPTGSEDRFERGPSPFGDPLKGHSHVAPIQAPLDRPLPTPPARRTRRLATAEQLREAFVLKEIVGPPRAIKREIR